MKSAIISTIKITDMGTKNQSRSFILAPSLATRQVAMIDANMQAHKAINIYVIIPFVCRHNNIAI